MALERHNSQGSFEGISDLLKCYICMDKLKDACICPHCSKISCFPCIMQWLRSSSRSDCPHCRAKLRERELIRIPFFDEINQHIESVKKKNGRMRTGNEMCSIHTKHTLTVYCQTCFKCICHECALWGQHKGHTVNPLDELYEQKKIVFTAELQKLKERMREILLLVEQVEMRMESVKTLKAKTQDDIDSTVTDIKGRLNEQLKVKLQKLYETRRYLKRQACEISAISTEMEGKMTGPVSELVTQSEELNKRLAMAICELKKKQQSELEIPPSIGGFTNEVIPTYESSFFIIHPFSELQEKGDEIYSNPLNFCGLSWRLKVYPNGTGVCEGRYLGVFVELYAGYNQSADYHYAVEMVYGAGMYKSMESERNHSSRNYCRDYGSDFAVGESWGYKKFYEIAKLGSEGFLVKDTLMLKFSVRHPTYHQKCRDLTMYTNDLKRKIVELKQQNLRLQQKPDNFMEGKPPAKHSHSHSSPAHTGSSTSTIAKTTSAQTVSGHLAPLPPQERTSSSHPGRSPHLSQPQAQSSYGRRDRLHRVESDVSRRRYPHNLMAQTSRLRQKSHQSVAGKRHGEMLFQQDMASYGMVPRRSEAKSDIPMSVREQRRRSYDPMIHNYDQRLLYAQQQQQQHSSAHMSMLNLGSTSLSQQDYQHRMNLSIMEGAGDGFSGTSLHQNTHHQVQPVQQHSTPSVVVNGYFETGSDSGSPTEDINFNMEDSSQIPTHTVGVMTSQLAPNSQHQLSQEILDYYDQSEMLSLKTLTQGEDPTMTPTYGMPLEMSQEVEMPYQRELVRPSCSQPHSSPPQVNRLGRIRYRMSLNDLSVITSSGKPNSSSLGESQFLSHSMHTLHEEPPMQGRPEGMQRTAAVATGTMSRPKAPPHHRSFGALNSLANELQMNVQGPPGLAGTVAARLAAPVSPLQPGSGQIQGRPMQGYPLQPQQQRAPQQQQQQQQVPAGQIQQQQTMPALHSTSPSQLYSLASQQYGPASQHQVPPAQQQPALPTQQQVPPTQQLSQSSTSASQSIPASEPQQLAGGVTQQQQREQSPQQVVSLTQPTEPIQQNKQEQQGKLRGSGRSYTYQREKKKNLEGRSSTPITTQLDENFRRLNASGKTSSNTSLSQIL